MALTMALMKGPCTLERWLRGGGHHIMMPSMRVGAWRIGAT